MSDPSQIPPGDRPPLQVPRVFRPFAGGPAGQGSQSPAAKSDPSVMGRRPAQPRRPFAGSQPIPSASESPPFEAATVEQGAWWTVVEQAPPALDASAEAIAATGALGDTPQPNDTPQPVTLEVPAIDYESSAPSSHEPALSASEKQPVVTVEVPAIPSVEPETRSAQAHVEPDPLDAPRFVAPASEPAADSLIDEVDAAFITAGLPSTGGASPTDDALNAAATLEAVARRLRAGEIALRAAHGASMSSQESTLATVLASLLANR